MKKFNDYEKIKIFGACYIKKPLTINPELAELIGLNEAIILQQLIYLIDISTADLKEGKKWTYQTYEDLQEQFPFFSISTIKRTIKKLVDSGLILKNNFNKYRYDRTTWYTINFVGTTDNLVYDIKSVSSN